MTIGSAEDVAVGRRTGVSYSKLLDTPVGSAAGVTLLGSAVDSGVLEASGWLSFTSVAPSGVTVGSAAGSPQIPAPSAANAVRTTASVNKGNR
jgi:hypothetical protein